MTNSFPTGRWRLLSPDPNLVAKLVEATGLPSLIAQVLLNRGHNTPHLAEVYIDPEIENLPSPRGEFSDLDKSVELLKEAIANGEKITICGDYDADGMTSTALLLRAFKHQGAEVNYIIPSRFKDGYGLNKRIVKECAEDNTAIILTVDNGISAYEPIQLAIELGLSVIVTDHHDIPDTLPPADAILNPKLLPESSPYRGIAGVGVAYILALTLAESLGMLNQELENQLLELLTLGTIADMAPLVGINRRWLKKGLALLPKSKLLGVQALIAVAGVKDEKKNLNPEDIGFKLGPRINAIGRIGDPQIVIDLLTTDDPMLAQQRALECQENNNKRQELCKDIEQQAIKLIEDTPIPWRELRVLLLVQPGWHHGVIGIVATRLVERYGAPVFIATYEEDGLSIRGSARGIEEFNVFEALTYCQDLFTGFGGHKKAGGFNLPTKNLAAFQQRLSEFAHNCLQPEHLQPLVKIDAQADFSQLNHYLFQQIDQLQPWGIDNEFPVFWTPKVRILEQKVVKSTTLKLLLQQDEQTFEAIAWRWGNYFPLPSPLDIAYKLSQNEWNNSSTLQLVIVGVRFADVNANQNDVKAIKKAIFEYHNRQYHCSFWPSVGKGEIRIKNDLGKVLVVSRGQSTGLLGVSRETAEKVDITANSRYYPLIKTAMKALGLG